MYVTNSSRETSACSSTHYAQQQPNVPGYSHDRPFHPARRLARPQDPRCANINSYLVRPDYFTDYSVVRKSNTQRNINSAARQPVIKDVEVLPPDTPHLKASTWLSDSLLLCRFELPLDATRQPNPDTYLPSYTYFCQPIHFKYTDTGHSATTRSTWKDEF